MSNQKYYSVSFQQTRSDTTWNQIATREQRERKKKVNRVHITRVVVVPITSALILQDFSWTGLRNFPWIQTRCIVFPFRRFTELMQQYSSSTCKWFPIIKKKKRCLGILNVNHFGCVWLNFIYCAWWHKVSKESNSIVFFIFMQSDSKESNFVPYIDQSNTDPKRNNIGYPKGNLEKNNTSMKPAPTKRSLALSKQKKYERVPSERMYSLNPTLCSASNRSMVIS